jgi:hypothetical protein
VMVVVDPGSSVAACEVMVRSVAGSGSRKDTLKQNG